MNKLNKKHNQSGLVSIMVASVLMVVMSLITLGFTRLVQNEQRQAIDDQLSKQAFYAAESGINIAASSIGFPGTRKDDCNVTDYNNGIITPDDPDVVFTCILIDPTPSDLVFGNDSITTNKSKVVPIKTPVNPASMTFQWKENSLSTLGEKLESDCSVAGAIEFGINSEIWDKIGMLDLDLVGIPIIVAPATTFSRDDLLNSQFSALFYPCDSGGSTSVPYTDAVGDGNVGKIIPVSCDISLEYQCSITITGVPNASEYYARFNSIYNEINLRITAEDSSNNPLLFANAQAVVDSTGRANDVFHRLQARIPLYENYNLPNASIQTLGDVCKLYEVQQNTVIDGCN